MRELIYKKGFLKKDKQRVPLTDNNIIEQVFYIHLAEFWTMSFVIFHSQFLMLPPPNQKKKKIFGRPWGSMTLYALKILCMRLLLLVHILRRLQVSYGPFHSTSQKMDCKEQKGYTSKGEMLAIVMITSMNSSVRWISIKRKCIAYKKKSRT